MRKLMIALLITAGAAGAQWRTIAELNTPRYGAAALVSGDSILVIGGLTSMAHHGLRALNSVEVFHPWETSWRYGVPLPESLAFAGAGLMDGKIFVFGGFKGTDELSNRIYAFDEDSGSWTLWDTMPFPAAAFSLVAVNGNFYILGGWEIARGIYNPWILKYEPFSGEWDTLTFPEWMPRVSMGSGTFRDTVLLFGGFYIGQVDWVSLFDGSSVQHIDNLPIPLSGTAVTVDSTGQFYVIGGFQSVVPTNRCWRYDPGSLSWQELPELPSGIGYASSVFYTYGGKGYVFVIGGKHRRHAVNEVRVLLTQSVSENEVEPDPGFDVRVPVPLRNAALIRVTSDTFGTMEVFDASGRLVRIYRIHSGVNVLRWDTHDLPSGIYIYRFRHRTGKWLYLR